MRLKQFIFKLLKYFEMEECNVISTPMLTLKNDSKVSTNKKIKLDNMETFPYRQAIGSLLHLANATRPDLVFAKNLSRKQVNYNFDNRMKVKIIFCD